MTPRSTQASQDPATPSKAAIAGHPIHPMLIAFPIAFLVAVPVTDIVFASTGDAFWARASLWLLTAGLITGVVAALPGLVDFLGIKRVRHLRAAWIHVLANVAVLAIAFANLMVRVGAPAEDIVPGGLVLSLVVAAGLGLSGWYGGELSYRHKVGVLDGARRDRGRAEPDDRGGDEPPRKRREERPWPPSAELH